LKVLKGGCLTPRNWKRGASFRSRSGKERVRKTFSYEKRNAYSRKLQKMTKKKSNLPRASYLRKIKKERGVKESLQKGGKKETSGRGD